MRSRRGLVVVRRLDHPLGRSAQHDVEIPAPCIVGVAGVPERGMRLLNWPKWDRNSIDGYSLQDRNHLIEDLLHSAVAIVRIATQQALFG